MDGRRPARADQLSLRSVDELISRGGFVFAGADRRGGRAADRESGRGPLSADVQATYSIRRVAIETKNSRRTGSIPVPSITLQVACSARRQRCSPPSNRRCGALAPDSRDGQLAREMTRDPVAGLQLLERWHLHLAELAVAADWAAGTEAAAGNGARRRYLATQDDPLAPTLTRRVRYRHRREQ